MESTHTSNPAVSVLLQNAQNKQLHELQTLLSSILRSQCFTCNH